MREVDDDGKITYTVNNFFSQKDFTVSLNAKIYSVDKNGNDAKEITDRTIIDGIVSSVDEVEFTLEAPAGK